MKTSHIKHLWIQNLIPKEKDQLAAKVHVLTEKLNFIRKQVDEKQTKIQEQKQQIAKFKAMLWKRWTTGFSKGIKILKI